KKLTLIASILVISWTNLFSQDPTYKSDRTVLKYSNKFSLGSDLFQPFLLGGFNINGTYMTNRWVFDYSHGVGLEIDDNFQTDEQQALNAEIEIPWTTGPGLGYRITNNLDVRLDFKAHRIEANLLQGQQEIEYTQFTIGPGTFYRFYFGKNTGFGLEASVRYWFDFGNDLDNLSDGNLDFVDNSGNDRSFDADVASGIGVNLALIYTFNKNK
ncbi:MAG: hypothetical protein AAF039_17800, partial [Bacteroidota bacterium]